MVAVVSDEVLSFSCGRPANDACAAGARAAQPEPLRFHVEVGVGQTIACSEVRGFHEAAVAARDARVTAPARLVLVGLDEDARSWVEAWSEDCDRVRRTVTIRRLLDDRALTAVVTLASYGYGVETALSVESVSPGPADGIPMLLRSGVHSKAMVQALLGLAALAPSENDDASSLLP